MDYEQKYKEALETIQEILNSGSDIITMARLKLRLQSVFTELKESDDDRIINNIKKAVESYWSDEPLQEILDWLEKQCEQKSAIKLERDDNGEAVLTPFEAELFSMMSEAWQGYSFGEEVNIAKIVKEHSKELLERANEQKPACIYEDEKPLLEKFKQAVYDCAWGKITCKVEGESKKEYAERWATQFLLMVRDWADDYIDYTIQQELRKSYNKGKKDAIKENSPAWSEDDENLFRCAIDAVKQESKVRTDGCLDEEVGEMVTDWLKSLKERYTWRPSDEQMENLSRAVNGGSYRTSLLMELYQDLKKLRNE